MLLDEKELLQQAFDPLYVSEAEAQEAFEKMRSEIAAASAKRIVGQFTFLFVIVSRPFQINSCRE